jgi:subtilisin family serine protease
MVRDRIGNRIKVAAVALALTAAAVLGCVEAAPVHAQSIMRSPSFNIGPRITRINPNITGRVMTNVDRFPRGVGRDCGNVAGKAGCQDQSTASTDGGGGSRVLTRTKHDGPPRGGSRTALNQRTVANEIVAEIDGSLSPVQADELARRHGLARLQSQNFPLIGATIGLFRVTDRRSVEVASREFSTEAGVRSVQPNFRYFLQEQKTKAAATDTSQYAVAKLHLPEAHKLAEGAGVRVAVIDSGIDVKHPELAGSILDAWDALGGSGGPHFHGTGVAGAIAAHVTVEGSAPKVQIIAIRAFGVVQSGAESTSFVLLKSFDHAASQNAQIINMSFAGPKDALIDRGITALAAKGIVLVAASGNAGPKSPPLYPAAYPKVIAVSGTDAQDRLFAASNRGDYIAVAAPGENIFLPAPDETYQLRSGTSFSAAFVSGIAALLLERNPALKGDDVRVILMQTARDLGAPGRDDLFGAGEADAYAAVMAVTPAPSLPVASSDQAATLKTAAQPAPDQKPLDQKGLPQEDSPPTRALASDRSAPIDAGRPAAR